LGLFAPPLVGENAHRPAVGLNNFSAVLFAPTSRYK
jgi:hypothetical protein